MNSLKSWMVVLLIASVLFVLMGCNKDNKNPTSQVDPAAADAKVQEANTQLEQVLFNLANGPGVQQPEDVDLSAAYNLYVDALRYQSDHPGANFGAGMLELVMLSRDSQVQAFFDRCKTMFDSAKFFEVGQGGGFMGGAPRATLPIMRLDQVSLPVFAPLKMMRGMCRTLDDNGPTVAELQAICSSSILPRVSTAAQRLSVVATHRDFVFTITPRMQGDDNEDPLKMDLTEVRFTLAVLNGLEAVLQHFCAYDLSLSAYDGAAMQEALSQSSSFARLKSDGSSRMHTARTAWLSAITNLDSAVSFLDNETEYQGDHVIHTDPYDDITQADLDSIRADLPLIRNALNSSQVFDMGPDVGNLEISLSAFFSTPVSNLKGLFPTYTVTLDSQNVDFVWHDDSRLVTANGVHIPTSNSYHWNRSAYYSNGVLEYEYADSNFSAPEWDQAFVEKMHELSNMPYASIYLYFSDYLSAGDHDLSATLSWYYNEPTAQRYVPRITWQANSFAEWVLPDPTLGGFLPGMTDTRFKDLFGITADHWEKTTTWYLW